MKSKSVRALALLVVSFPLLAGEVTFKPVELTPPRYFLVLKRDATTVVTAPLQWDRRTWTRVGVGAGMVGIVFLADAKVREEIIGHSNESVGQAADAVEPFGGEYSWAVLAGFYGAGRLFDNERAQSVAEDGFASSLIAAGLITPALKTLAGRTRPSQSAENYQFGEAGGASFPSGHTTQAFAIAAVIAEHYDNIWIDAAAYGLAGMVGYARIEHQAHFASDVVVGALIGYAVGKVVVRLHQIDRRRIRLEPIVSRAGAPGLSFRIKLSK